MPSMTEDQLIELFNQALDLAPEARADWLSQVCPGDVASRDQLAAMLDFAPLADEGQDHWFKPLIAELAQQNDQSPIQIGQKLGRYEIIAELGQGGMGRVLLAYDQHVSRRVAIKMLPHALRLDPKAVRRFQREAHAAAALNHPNIMTVYEVGDDADMPYFTCEHIAGVTLRERMQSGALPWQEIVKIATQVASALQTAHESGIVHRDIKPENVMLRTDGLVKVLDFGIAKHLDLLTFDSANEAQPTNGNGAINVYQTNFTRTQGLLGTSNYMSPEQLRGEELTPQTDVFSLGLMLYEMLAEHPYAALSPAEKLSALQSADELPPLGKLRPDIPTALAELVTQATRKAVAARIITAEQMHSTLEELHSSLEMRAAGQSQQLAQERANKLLNQVAALYASDAGTRLSLTEWWTIQRRSNALRGKLEQKLLRQSLLSILAKASAVAGLAALLALLLAAWFSITEKWDERVMHDGHSRRVMRLALSPDGKKLFSVSYDKKVIVWDLARRERQATLSEHNAQVTAVAISPDGKWFATIGSDLGAFIWDAERLTKVAEFPGPRDLITSIAFTPNGRLFVGPGDPDRKDTRNVWEVGTWRKLGSLPYDGSFLLSPDSRLLVNGNWQTFDLSSGNEVANGEGRPFGNGALSPDGTRLAGVDSGGFVSFWDVSRFWRTGERRLLNRFLAHRDHGHAIAYSPDGRLVASASENIILWDARMHEILARFTAKDTVNDVIFSHDSRQIISGHGDGAIIIWDIAQKAQVANLAEHGGPVYAASFSPDGKSVLSASEDNSVFIWDAASGLKRRVLTGHQSPVKSAEFSRDGQWAVTSDLSHNVKVWDAATGEELRSFALPRNDDTLFNYGAALSLDSRWVVTSFGVYATEDGHTAVQFSPRVGAYPPDIRGWSFSSDGRWLACAGTGGYIALWDVAQWQLRQELSVGGNFNAVAFARDNRSLVIGDNNGGIQLWQIEPLKRTGDVGKTASGVEQFAFSPDGRILAAASDNETLSLWDITRRRHIRDVGQHILPVLAVGFAPDGRLVTGEQDSSVRVYTRQLSLWGWPLDWLEQ